MGSTQPGISGKGPMARMQHRHKPGLCSLSPSMYTECAAQLALLSRLVGVTKAGTDCHNGFCDLADVYWIHITV